METTVIISKEYCELEAVRYIASRYHTTPVEVLKHYLEQAGIVKAINRNEADYELTHNEIALFQDLGIQPSCIEFK